MGGRPATMPCSPQDNDPIIYSCLFVFFLFFVFSSPLNILHHFFPPLRRRMLTSPLFKSETDDSFGSSRSADVHAVLLGMGCGGGGRSTNSGLSSYQFTCLLRLVVRNGWHHRRQPYTQQIDLARTRIQITQVAHHCCGAGFCCPAGSGGSDGCCHGNDFRRYANNLNLR